MLSEDEIRDMEEWGYHDQPNYSPYVREALRSYQYLYRAWKIRYHGDWNESRERAALAQDAIQELIRRRKAETGTGYYLPPDQYDYREHNR